MKKKFYQMTRMERLAFLEEVGTIDATVKKEWLSMNLSEEIADHLIENQVSEVSIPLGLAFNTMVNGKQYVVPLATEEPSVVAACSNGAKMLATTGGCHSQMEKKWLRGQIVLMNVQQPEAIKQKIIAENDFLFAKAAEIYPSIVKRGGGLRKITVRSFPEDASFLSVDFDVDTQDAMGANMLNTILEGMAAIFRTWFAEEILFSILSNYATEAVVTVKGRVTFDALGSNGAQVAEKIAAASTYAQLDPYRAATHNKGIMNGIEAAVLATGNDTRAVSAAVHAYAAKDGQYRGLSQWRVVDGYLEGTLAVPLALGIVGGATKVLPKAQTVLHVLAIDDSKELAQVIASVGLAQNLAALRALVSEGIQQGHMSLQSRSLALSVGATGDEIQQVAEQLKQGPMNEAMARTILDTIRKNKR